MKDYYAILGLDETATPSDIVRAHHQLSLQFHPDNFNGDILFKDMHEDIQEAYEVLRDVTGRTEYDEMYKIKKDLDNIELRFKELKSQYDFEEPEENELEENDSYLISDTDHTNETQSDLTEKIHFEDFEEENPLVQDTIDEEEINNKEVKPLQKEIFWSGKGRVGRTTYLFRLILLGFISYLIFLASGYDNDFLISIIVITYIIIVSIQAAKRLHDMNASAWLLLINFIPYVNGVFWLILLFVPGTKGPNKYGDEPKNIKLI